MVLSALPLLAARTGNGLHLTGTSDFEKVKQAYAARGVTAVVKPFLAEMDLALGAWRPFPSSRSGASSLAEIAAMRLPSLLVPYPTAADNHQFTNATVFAKTGAAKFFVEQKNSTPGKGRRVAKSELVEIETARATMQVALARWHAPKAAEQIAEIIFQNVAQPEKAAQAKAKKCGCGHAHGSARHAH